MTGKSLLLPRLWSSYEDAVDVASGMPPANLRFSRHLPRGVRIYGAWVGRPVLNLVRQARGIGAMPGFRRVAQALQSSLADARRQTQ